MNKACWNNSPNQAKVFLFLGADPIGFSDYSAMSQPYEFGSLITGAAYHSDSTILRMLLENGANPNYEEGDGTTPLATAVHQNNARGVKLLLEYGANPWHSENWSALDQARKLGFRELEPIIQPFLSP